MNVVAWDPFNINQVFNRYSRTTEHAQSKDKTVRWSPLVDIYEAGEQYLLRAELPGVDKNTVEIYIDENVLTLKGEKSFSEANEGEKWTRVETRHGKFSRSFTLPEDTDVDKVSAKCKNGVLELAIPKTEPVKPKTIDIKIH